MRLCVTESARDVHSTLMYDGFAPQKSLSCISDREHLDRVFQASNDIALHIGFVP